MFDTNEDDLLDAEEYVMFDEAREANRAAFGSKFGTITKDGTFGMTMKFNDRDKDGVVSLQEFKSVADGWIQFMDRNADGVITCEDFRLSTN
jgi:Ca2+-binding EF-hand superfamily protein